MDNTYTPLVTDEHIERASGDPIAAQAVSAYEFGKCIGMARGMASARSTYEAERVQTHAELAELRVDKERIREALQEVYDIYDRKGGVAPMMTQRAIQMVREALSQRH